MGDHAVRRELCGYLVGLEEQGGLFEHLAAEGLGEVLALGVYAGFEGELEGGGGFVQGLGE